MKNFIKNYLFNVDCYFSKDWKKIVNLTTILWVFFAYILLDAVLSILKEPVKDISDYCAMAVAFYLFLFEGQPAVIQYRKTNPILEKILYHTFWILSLSFFTTLILKI